MVYFLSYRIYEKLSQTDKYLDERKYEEDIKRRF